MRSIESKREREKRMVSQMIALYCRKNHGTKGALCPECAALNDYARQRTINSPLWRQKPSAQTAGFTATSPKCVRKSAKSCAFRDRG